MVNQNIFDPKQVVEVTDFATYSRVNYPPQNTQHQPIIDTETTATTTNNKPKVHKELYHALAKTKSKATTKNKPKVITFDI